MDGTAAGAECEPSSGPDAAKSKEYWSKVDATVDGMLGGFSRISAADISESRKFLSHFFQSRKSSPPASAATAPLTDQVTRPEARLAIDCGAGIGRITKLLLLSFAHEVHLLEQSQAFIDKSVQYIGQENTDRVKRICASLQSFRPEDGVMYDVVWLQWVTGYLTDAELVAFLVKMAASLNRKHGLIIVKDNTTSGCDPVVDMDDSSVTRPKHSLLQIFASAGLTVRQEARQRKLPRGLYPVFMFALSPSVPPDLVHERVRGLR